MGFGAVIAIKMHEKDDQERMLGVVQRWTRGSALII